MMPPPMEDVKMLVLGMVLCLMAAMVLGVWEWKDEADAEAIRARLDEVAG